MSDAELRGKLLYEVQVLHPSAGLAGFQADEALHVHDLLAPPARRASSWGRAVAVDAGPGRLLGVEAEEVPDLSDVLDAGRDDIGSEAPESLPPAPDESKLEDLKKALSRAGRPGLKLLKWLTAHAPKLAHSPTWVNKLEEWANQKLLGAVSGLEAMRRKELERLQKMLAANPDEGLRHAIPLRDMGTRGLAPPGARLGTRDVNFSLSGLRSGGRASDPWFVPPDVIQTLRDRYREAANRELRLGRYRRAAYIFAELLGDFAAAAGALEQGRHYREAAVLYREHLKNPRKAAECLEHGGLLAEAIALYEELKMFEKAGDLHARLDQADDAVRCYRAQVDDYLARPDYLAAARLLETKLSAPDEALDVLSGAWPYADASGTCLRASFQLLARLARHDEAAARVGKLRAGAAPVGLAATLAQVLADVATTYPEQNVRTLGADATRVVAGRELSPPTSAGTSDREKMARAVGRLAPEDRLLARDVERFLARPKPRPVPPRPTVRGAHDPAVLRSFRLPEGVTWKAAAATGDGFYAFGIAKNGFAAVRGLWDGRTQSAFALIDHPWPSEAEWGLQPVPGRPLVTLTPPIPLALPLTFAPTDAFPAEVTVGNPAWLPDDVITLGHNESGLTWLLREPAEGQLSLIAHRSDTGALIATHALGSLQIPTGWQQLVTRGEHVFVTWGEAVLRFGPATGLRLEPTRGPVRQLAVSSQYMRLQAAAALEEGGLLLASHDAERSHPFGEGLTRPAIAFTRGGALVAADAQTGRVYRTEANSPHRRGDFTAPGPGLIALTATHRLHEFAAFTADGKVTVYQIPA